MRRAIVTGSKGFLGRHLVLGLRQRGVDVTTLGRHTAADASHIAIGEAPWCPTRLARIIEAAEPDAIFHLAGDVTGSPATLQEVNAGLAGSIMQALSDVQARPVLVCCGSAAEYGSAIEDGVPVAETAACGPASAYGMSKFAQTTTALAFGERTGTPVLVARIFNLIGPGMPIHLALGDFARQIALQRAPQATVQTGNIHVFRDFIDVDHVVTALWALARDPAARGVVNVCSGEATRLSHLVDELVKASGKKVTIETAASRMRPGEVNVIVGSTARLCRLGAAPPPTNYPEVVARVWRAAETHWTTAR